jgi:hypothetical protein
MPKKFVEYEFWIKSSRGTNREEIYKIPANKAEDKPFIESELERWCSQFGAWHVSENVVHYGFRPVKKNDTKS